MFGLLFFFHLISQKFSLSKLKIVEFIREKCCEILYIGLKLIIGLNKLLQQRYFPIDFDILLYQKFN